MTIISLTKLKILKKSSGAGRPEDSHLKSLAVSQIVYVLSSLPTSKGVIKEVNALLYDFLWDNKGDKIKRTEMINDYSKGGLKMIDIASPYFTALQYINNLETKRSYKRKVNLKNLKFLKKSIERFKNYSLIC